VAAEGQQGTAVTIEHDLERGLVAAAELLHEPLVARPGEEKARAREDQCG
jgi:hypothetical protein